MSRDHYPTVCVAVSSWFSHIALGAFRPSPYPKQCSLCLPVQPPLASGGCEHLDCCSPETCCYAGNLWVLIIYLFFPLVIFPCEIPRLATDLLERVFPDIWKLLSFLRLPSWDGTPSLPLSPLFLSSIFFPTSFRRQWSAFLGA